jgi:predicted Fe-Mo cluster-binding NifX family protein
MTYMTLMVLLLALADPKIAVTATEPRTDSEVEPQFGRTSWFMIYDPAEETWRPVDNTREARTPGGAGVGAARMLAGRNVTVVITGRCGPKALRELSSAGIRVFQGAGRTVEEALDDYQAQRLEEIK